MSVLDLADYPWDAVVPFRECAQQHPDGLVDLSVGSPIDPTPEVIRRALVEATDAHGYPQTMGTSEVRRAIVDWYARRRGVPDLAEANVIPTIGSKELVALLPTLLGLGPDDTVAIPRIAYPSYEVGARVVGAKVVAEDDPAQWPEGTKLIWINTPGNPDGRVWGVEALAAAVSRSRELGAVLASDECYAELGWEGEWATQPVPTILDPRVTGGSRSGLLSVYSLSKQSNLAGYRAAFIAGCKGVVGRIVTARKHLGLMPPAPVQHAMVAALRDDAHVATQKALYRERRALLKPALQAAGFRIDSSEAGLYLWATEGRDAWESMQRLADLGILAGPGPFYGPHSVQHVRFALTAPTDAVRRAAQRLSAAKL